MKQDGTFAQAGVPDAQVLQLQKLGEVLERSKVQPQLDPRFKSMGWFGKMTGAAGKYTGASQVLAYLMTHPDAMSSTIDFVNRANKGVPSAVGATHRYDESSGQVIPIQ
jgi:hypothetical protein